MNYNNVYYMMMIFITNKMKKMKWIRNNKIYTVIIVFFIITNIFLIVKLKTKSFDNDFSGGIEITIFKMIIISMIVIYFFGFLLASKFNINKRKLFVITALVSLIPLLLLLL